MGVEAKPKRYSRDPSWASKIKEEDRKERDSVKYNFGLPQALFHLRKRKDPRIDELRESTERFKKTKLHLEKLNKDAPEDYFLSLEIDLKERLMLVEHAEEMFQDVDFQAAKTALDHYNDKNGVNYRLEECLGTCTRFLRGTRWSHTNFIARCTSEGSADTSPKLFFAELVGLSQPRKVSYCDILQGPVVARGCKFCPHMFGHPLSGHTTGCLPQRPKSRASATLRLPGCPALK